MDKYAEPHQISEEEFNNGEYEKIAVDYDIENDSYSELGQVYDDEERASCSDSTVVDALNNGVDDVVYVRNDDLETDFEIARF